MSDQKSRLKKSKKLKEQAAEEVPQQEEESQQQQQPDVHDSSAATVFDAMMDSADAQPEVAAATTSSSKRPRKLLAAVAAEASTSPLRKKAAGKREEEKAEEEEEEEEQPKPSKRTKPEPAAAAAAAAASSVPTPKVAAPAAASFSSTAASRRAAAAAADDGLISLNNPAAEPVREIPPNTNFSNPNQTLRYFSLMNKLNVHYTELGPKKHFTLSYTAGKPQFNNKPFVSIKCTKMQRFDATGGSKFQDVAFGKAVIFGPFGVTRYPRMFPYGNRDQSKTSKFPPPKDVGKLKYMLPLTNISYGSSTVEKPGVGIVDADMDLFLGKWLRGLFDPWVKEEAYKMARAGQFFTARLAEIEQPLKDQRKAMQSAYDEQVKAWEATNDALAEDGEENPEPRPTKPADLSDKKYEEKLRAAFMLSGMNPSVKSSEKASYESVMFTRPLLRTVPFKERELNKQYNHPCPWYAGQFTDPPDFTCEGKPASKGYKRLANEELMWRCVTADEAREMKAQGRVNPCPYRLVPWENRFVVDGDITAPVFGFVPFDSKPGAGIRLEKIGVIWLGERGGLNDGQEPIPGVDPTTYFLTAQKYTRTKATFNPDTVENSAALDKEVGSFEDHRDEAESDE
jgi:hypothetical protein